MCYGGGWASATEGPLVIIFDRENGKFSEAWEGTNLTHMNKEGGRPISMAMTSQSMKV